MPPGTETADMQMAGIELEHVELRLGGRDFRFDCAIPAGAITAITGASGAGKSTLLNLVAGFATPSAGRIRITCEDVTGWHPSRRPVSIIFQENNLFAHLDVATNIGLGISPALRLDAADRAQIEHALERVGLDGFGKRMPPDLQVANVSASPLPAHSSERSRFWFSTSLSPHSIPAFANRCEISFSTCIEKAAIPC